MGEPNKVNGVAEALASHAYLLGRRAGLQGLPCALALGQPGTLEHDQWLAGWRSGNSDLAYQNAMRWPGVAPVPEDIQ